MVTKLKNLHLTSVDLVREGANQKADICIFKSNREESIMAQRKKKMIGFWERLFNRGTVDNGQGMDTVRQGEIPETYLQVVITSIESIIADQGLTEAAKIVLAEKSLREYHAKMLELIELSVCDGSGKAEIDEILEV